MRSLQIALLIATLHPASLFGQESRIAARPSAEDRISNLEERVKKLETQIERLTLKRPAANLREAGVATLKDAILTQNLTEVKRFVEAGANVNLSDPNAGLPLQTALLSYQADIFEYLLISGADPNLICRLRKMSTVQMVASGFFVDSFMEDIHSPKHKKMYNLLDIDESRILQLIYAHHGDFGRVNSKGQTPLEHAIENGCQRTAAKIRQLLSESAPP